MKIRFVKELIIETTRRCNMTCAHCLRGDAQNKDISSHTLAYFFDGFVDGAEIGNITFTGGEISLNVPAILETLQLCQKHKFTVNDVFFATNGKDKEKVCELISAASEWQRYVIDPEKSGFALSKDEFHEPIDQDTERIIMALPQYDDCKDMTQPYYRNMYVLLDEGRAKTLECEKAEPDILPIKVVYKNNDEFSIEEGILYLTATGNILTACDLSFSHEDCRAIATVQQMQWTNTVAIKGGNIR